MRTNSKALALLLTLAATLAASDASARCHGRGRVVMRSRARVTVRYSAPVAAHAPPRAFYATPAPVYAAPKAVAAPGEAGAFLGMLNAWRASHGRGPVGWDASLASYAAGNAGVHAPGSSGGGMQCWASTSSLTSAFRMWVGSPAHAAILLNATTAVGASPCASGATCNAR